jgi:flagellar motor switch protein FliG
MPAEHELKSIPLDASQMTKLQKLAALLIIIGPEAASQVMKDLGETELEAVAAEMARIPMIPAELQLEVLKEFTAVANEASSSVLGGVGYAQAALEKSVGPYRASNILGRVSAGRAPVAAMQTLADMEPRQIYNLIKNEQPQTVALVMSYLGPQKSAQLLVQLPAELRDQIVERLATLAPTPIEVVEKVVEVLNLKAGVQRSRGLNQTGGLKTAADLLNALDKTLSKSLLISIEERNTDLGTGIRAKMFTFEDLIRLDKPSLQKILREIDMRDLAVALKPASEKLKNALLSCISKRAAETVNEEMSFMGVVKAREIDAAQQRIIEVLRRLESEGEIELDVSKPAEAQP